MKINKVFYGVMAIILLIILGYHYKLNYNSSIQPPSEKWAKEVLIAEGNIKGFSSITKYNDNYIVAFNEGENIKVISVDSVGKVIKQVSLSTNTEFPQNINVFENDGKILLSYFVIGSESGELQIVALDENLSTLDNTVIQGPKDYIKVNDNVLGAVYKEKIDLINLSENKVTTVETGGDTALVSSVEYGNKYCIIYSNIFGNLNYFFMEDGVISDMKSAGGISEYSKVKFRSMISIIDKDIVTNLIEYVFNSDYIGYKYISFSLESGEAIGRGEFPIKFEGVEKGYIYNGSGISIATPAPYKDESGKLLISTARDVAKGKSQTDILEMKIENKLGVMMDTVSRTKSVSINPAVYKDTLVFLDPIKKDYGKLYITSTRNDFKEYNNKIRNDEKVQALIENIEGLLFSFAYVVTYGMIWIIPAISLFSILSLLEYRYSYTVRKSIFIIAYMLTTILKIFVVRNLSFVRFQSFIPTHFTFTIGMAAMSIISLVCLLYGYVNYKDDLEKNVMALSYSKPIFIDSFLTLALFVGFLK
ncbi:hypothetical protein [Clostridium sp.]|uniref:hypothetical protein n=1 Tax=Clostridium sp. TaxID=1506 RepID=UPI002FC64350